MTNWTRELTKEQYDELMAASNGKGYVPPDYETKYFSMTLLRGCGLYGTRVYEYNGKYYLDYNTGETCD